MSNDQTIRCFIALELSEEIRACLQDLQNTLKECRADIRWVAPVNIHLTLKFLGEIPRDSVGSITEYLHVFCGKNQATRLCVNNLGVFPSSHMPKVVWVGITEHPPCLERWTDIMNADLVSLGIPREDRPFNAHITLGRIKSGKNIRPLKEAISGLKVPAELCQDVGEISLIQSTLTPTGPVYTVLARCPLPA